MGREASRPLTVSSLGLLALMASGPFLFPFHPRPIPSFWSEWWAAALGLAAAVSGLLAARDRPLALPATLGIPAVLLSALLLQFALGRPAFPQTGLLYATYLLWAGLLMILGRSLAETVGLARLADVLAGAFALGALAGAGVALAQWLGLDAGVPWMFHSLGRNAIHANLGQTNHHAHYSWLGIASVFHLRGRGRLSRPLLWLAVLPIALGSVLSGSRSVFLYPIILLAAIAWARHRAPEGSAKRLMADAWLLLPAVVALNFLGAWASAYLSSAPTLPASRLYESVSGSSARLAVARTAWSAFAEHPWLGVGAGNYPWASFQAAARQGGDGLLVAENAHNVLLHLLAESGAPAAGAVLLMLALWARRFLGRPWEMEHLWCAAALGIGAAHALLEYPLWYAYFLGPAALLLGATDGGRAIALPGRRTALYAILAALAGAPVLANLRADYAAIESVTYWPLAGDPDRERAWRHSMDRLLTLHRESLLSPWALLAFASLAEPSRQQAQDRAALCERGIRFSPARSLIVRCAMQLAIAGRNEDAVGLTRAVLRAYPAQRAETAGELERGMRAFPEVVPLWRSSRG